jgi:hypothetical protein
MHVCRPFHGRNTRIEVLATYFDVDGEAPAFCLNCVYISPTQAPWHVGSGSILSRGEQRQADFVEGGYMQGKQAPTAPAAHTPIPNAPAAHMAAPIAPAALASCPPLGLPLHTLPHPIGHTHQTCDVHNEDRPTCMGRQI